MVSAAHPRPIAESGRGPAGSLDCRVATLLAVTVCGATVCRATVSGRRTSGLGCRAAVIASAAKQSRARQGARGGNCHGFRCRVQPSRGKWSHASRFAGLPRRRHCERSEAIQGVARCPRCPSAWFPLRFPAVSREVVADQPVRWTAASLRSSQ